MERPFLEVFHDVDQPLGPRCDAPSRGQPAPAGTAPDPRPHPEAGHQPAGPARRAQHQQGAEQPRARFRPRRRQAPRAGVRAGLLGDLAPRPERRPALLGAHRQTVDRGAAEPDRSTPTWPPWRPRRRRSRQPLDPFRASSVRCPGRSSRAGQPGHGGRRPDPQIRPRRRRRGRRGAAGRLRVRRWRAAGRGPGRCHDGRRWRPVDRADQPQRPARQRGHAGAARSPDRHDPAAGRVDPRRGGPAASSTSSACRTRRGSRSATGSWGRSSPQAQDVRHDVADDTFTPNVEAVLALQPDLVIQWGDQGTGLIAPLENAGLAVVGLRTGPRTTSTPGSRSSPQAARPGGTRRELTLAP